MSVEIFLHFDFRLDSREHFQLSCAVNSLNSAHLTTVIFRWPSLTVMTFCRIDFVNASIENKQKSKFFCRSARVSGHQVNQLGARLAPQYLDKVCNIEPPSNPKQLKSFFGLSGWCSWYVPHMISLLKPSVADFQWLPVDNTAFEHTKLSRTSETCLADIDDKADWVDVNEHLNTHCIVCVWKFYSNSNSENSYIIYSFIWVMLIYERTHIIDIN